MLSFGYIVLVKQYLPSFDGLVRISCYCETVLAPLDALAWIELLSNDTCLLLSFQREWVAIVKQYLPSLDALV